MPASLTPGLVLGEAVTDETLLAVATLEADLERQTSLREALGRRIERARHDHEDDYERILMRCRQLEDGEIRRVDATARAFEIRIAELQARIADLEQDHRDALERQLRESAQATADRLAEAERRHHAAVAEREQALARSHAATIEEVTRSHQAVRDRAAEAYAFEIAERDDRVVALQGQMAKAETEFRKEAYRLSALIALQAQNAESARAEASALQERLAHVYASSSWRLLRPLRVLTYVLRRAMKATRRLARAVRSPR